jgi:leucyl aminopeptidase
MKIALTTETIFKSATDIIALGVAGRGWEKTPNVVKLDKAMSGSLLSLAADEGFTGKAGETLRVPARGRVKANWVLLVGGQADDATPADLVLLGVKVAKASKRQKSATILLGRTDAEAVRSVAQGLEMGAYRYSTHLTGSRRPKGGLKSASIIVENAKDAALVLAAKQGKIIAESVASARDLVNGPPNHINPISLADFAEQQAEKHGLTWDIWGKDQLETEGMNLFLAVNSGSAIPPRFIHLSYTPKGVEKPKRVVFVGKGLTFDAGGLCIKPAGSMVDMKIDMAGSAVTLGVVLAAARLKLPIEVHAVIGSTENMTGAAAYRPGDVFTSHQGKTVEIINTDAEGRLVLADILSWAVGLKPDFMIDHATLTGACVVALGNWTAGFFSPDEELTEKYMAAAGHTGESYWRLPLLSDLRETLKSSVADIKHTGTRWGGAISAALFLKEFVGKTRWAHVDIAGPSHLDRAHGVMPKGGTGFGVATGVRFLESLCEE